QGLAYRFEGAAETTLLGAGVFVGDAFDRRDGSLGVLPEVTHGRKLFAGARHLLLLDEGAAHQRVRLSAHVGGGLGVDELHRATEALLHVVPVLLFAVVSGDGEGNLGRLRRLLVAVVLVAVVGVLDGLVVLTD